MKKSFIFAAVAIAAAAPLFVFAQGFVPLAEIPGLTDPATANTPGFANFFNNLYKFLIGIAAVLAIIMIIWGGLQYATQDIPGAKQEGKDRILQAILGLVLVLSPVLVFSIINPSILNLSLKIDPLKTVPPVPTGTASSPSGPPPSTVDTGVTGCTALQNALTEVIVVNCSGATPHVASSNAQNVLSQRCSSGKQILRNPVGSQPISVMNQGITSTSFSKWTVTGYCSPIKTVYIAFSGKISYVGGGILYTPRAFYGDTATWAAACSGRWALWRSVALADIRITGSTFRAGSLGGRNADTCPAQYASYKCAKFSDIYCASAKN